MTVLPIEEEPDLQLACDLFNQQEDRRTDFFRLQANGRCRNPETLCKQPRRPEAVLDEYGRFRIQWEECRACQYCDDEPE